jgi:predicted nuclease of predicted toxin-antitoxin system
MKDSGLMKVLVDVNLSPAWGGFFTANQVEAKHWSLVGRSDAQDGEVMQWARSNGFIVFTHDLDFGALLALAG